MIFIKPPAPGGWLTAFMAKAGERRSADRSAPHSTAALTLRIAERVAQLAHKRHIPHGGELQLWLEAEAEVKRELSQAA